MLTTEEVVNNVTGQKETHKIMKLDMIVDVYGEPAVRIVAEAVTRVATTTGGRGDKPPDVAAIPRLPRESFLAQASRTIDSRASDPGGSLSLRSRPRPFTVRTSQCQEVSPVTPSARPNPVMLLSGIREYP